MRVFAKYLFCNLRSQAWQRREPAALRSEHVGCGKPRQSGLQHSTAPQRLRAHPGPVCAALPGPMPASSRPGVGGRACPGRWAGRSAPCSTCSGRGRAAMCSARRAASLGTAAGTGTKRGTKRAGPGHVRRARHVRDARERTRRAPGPATAPRPRHSAPAPSTAISLLLPFPFSRAAAALGRHRPRPRTALSPGACGSHGTSGPRESAGAASVTEEEGLGAQGAHALHVHGTVLHRGTGARVTEGAALRADAH